jgi:thymidylate kinase
MKLLIIEGGDNLGKSLLIKSLCEHFNYDNVTIRHFGKPPKGMSKPETLAFQFQCFNNEAELYKQIKELFSYSKYNYYDNVVIWNRSHCGEFVYGQMFRDVNPQLLKDLLSYYEKFTLDCLNDKNIYLITLTADPEFFLSKEDGQSFSKNLEEKTRELELFKEAHEISLIKNKKIIKVDQNNQFKLKEDIFQEALTFINL